MHKISAKFSSWDIYDYFCSGILFARMKKKYVMKLSILTLFCFIIGFSFAQNEHSTSSKKIPSVVLKDMKGKSVNTAEMGLEGPIVIRFWATWCSPCKKELNTIHELYPDWQDETGVTLVAVSIDDEKTKARVPVYVNGKAWDYKILLDPNGDFKRAMGVNNVPHTFLIDSDGNIVYSDNNYAPGYEDKLFEEILKLGAK